MKLNILSDLHLGQGGLPPPRTDADLVVLAGDIARPAAAMAWAESLEKPVLYVPGNHEFYGGSLSGVAAQLQRLSAGTRVRVLDRGEAIVDGVRFLGATLWTDFLLFGEGPEREAAVQEAVRHMRDFSRIGITDDSEALFTPQHAAQLCAQDAGWLSARLAEPHPGPTVVVTHHAPSALSIHPRFADSQLNPCFVSRLEHLLSGERVQLWVHGHTHDSFDYQVNGTRVVCNSRGYPLQGNNENALFDPQLVLEVS